MKPILILLIAALALLTACTNSKHSSSGKPFKQLAWNEDSVHSCLYKLIDDKKFSYTFIDKDNGKETKRIYSGQYAFTEDENSGKLFLKYDKGLQPPATTNYLIIESGGNYFFQPFTNGDPRMYLRIQFRRLR